ncbi:hypothetical protein L21SP2_1573 [Salinispira pacifica]|uniref:Uncharacterized protein n=1 Tax=Salinispira pacifica TaxID=1307761 RepID=V5WGK3_9SPIO|nr:hypothetical protein L21SP2_1573 [Salinispira pacifica]
MVIRGNPEMSRITGIPDGTGLPLGTVRPQFEATIYNLMYQRP